MSVSAEPARIDREHDMYQTQCGPLGVHSNRDATNRPLVIAFLVVLAAIPLIAQYLPVGFREYLGLLFK